MVETDWIIPRYGYAQKRLHLVYDGGLGISWKYEKTAAPATFELGSQDN